MLDFVKKPGHSVPESTGAELASFQMVVSQDRTYESYSLPDLDFMAEDIEREIAAIPGDTSESMVQHGGNTLADLIKKALPTTKIAIIKKALQWERSDDLLQGLIDTKLLFTITGFGLVCKPVSGSALESLLGQVSSGNKKSSKSEESEGEPPAMGTPAGGVESPGVQTPFAGVDVAELPDELKAKVVEQIEFQKKLNLITRKHQWYDLTKQIIKDWFVTDNCVLYWHINMESSGPGNAGQSSSNSDIPDDPNSTQVLTPGLDSIVVLDQTDVEWDDSFGSNVLKVRIPAAIINKVTKVIGETGTTKPDEETIRGLIEREGIPRRFIEAIVAKESMVELKNEEGDFWLVKTKGRKHHGLATPSMYNIFLPLEIRKMFIEGDYSAAELMKHFILHCTYGESIESGPLAGQRSNWAKGGDIRKLYDSIKSVNRASRMVTNHTVAFNFVHPPKEMFDPAKYKKHEANIYAWSGVSVILHVGEGGTYGSGHIGIRRTLSQAIDARVIVTWLVTEFFDHPLVKQIVGVPDECEVVPTFDYTILKEPRELLEELKFMAENSFVDPATVLSELHRDPNEIRRAKLEAIQENAASRVWEPVSSVMAQKGGSSDNSVGRPANTDSVVDDESRDQSPTT